ncbi:MAG: hypothetical protein KZQ96_22670 [Candidatus Thiodiazotropha sp. (ex Lucinoma borealis)]|nr:hypothetical protein [Candidatus Thiodiazotropha sp. (ex Lucinoma borealis)]
MPRMNTVPSLTTKFHFKSISYETLAASWFTSAGWEVLMPIIDHGKKTDLVVADDSNYYRIQIKSLETNDEGVFINNMWDDANINYIIYFSRIGNWGYIVHPFNQKRKRLNSPGHIRFHQHPKNFLITPKPQQALTAYMAWAASS